MIDANEENTNMIKNSGVFKIINELSLLNKLIQ